MILHCPISGITYKCEGILCRLEQAHPVFSLGYTELAAIAKHQWQERKLNELDTRLLCLALMHCTGLVNWKQPAAADFDTSIAESCIPRLLDFNSFLFDTARKYDRSEYFPRVTVTEEESSLEQLEDWVRIWESCITEYFRDLAALRASRARIKKEADLAHAIRTSQGMPSKYIKSLASWAAQAAQFPQQLITVGSGKEAKKLACSEYWQYILHCMGCKDNAGDYRIYSINRADIAELQDWILDHLSLDSTNAFMVTELINNALADLNFFGGQNFNLKANIEANAEFLELPTLEEPRITDYPSKLDYYKALALYASQKQALEQAKQINGG